MGLRQRDTGLTMDEIRFILFEIKPSLDGAVGSGVPQRCARGHEWDFGFKFIGISIDMSTLGITNGEENFCVFCLRDALRNTCGRVKDA